MTIDGRALELINDGMGFLPREHAIMDHPEVAKLHRAMAPRRAVRVQTTGNKVSAYAMVKALIESGCPMEGTPLAAQLTNVERAELGL